MMKVTAPSLQQLVSRLHAQALKIATLRSALDVQFSRITRRQAELDVFADMARRRRQTLRRPIGPTTIATFSSRPAIRDCPSEVLWTTKSAFGSTTGRRSSCPLHRTASPPGPWSLRSGLTPAIQVGQGPPRRTARKDGGGEKKYEERYSQHLDRYYDEVINQLGQPEALLIFGPGEAKLQLKERLSRSKALAERVSESRPPTS